MLALSIVGEVGQGWLLYVAIIGIYDDRLALAQRSESLACLRISVSFNILVLKMDTEPCSSCLRLPVYH